MYDFFAESSDANSEEEVTLTALELNNEKLCPVPTTTTTTTTTEREPEVESGVSDQKYCLDFHETFSDKGGRRRHSD